MPAAKKEVKKEEEEEEEAKPAKAGKKKAAGKENDEGGAGAGAGARAPRVRKLQTCIIYNWTICILIFPYSMEYMYLHSLGTFERFVLAMYENFLDVREILSSPSDSFHPPSRQRKNMRCRGRPRTRPMRPTLCEGSI